MSEKMLRHFIALVATLVCGLAYTAGYVSGAVGWWLTGAIVIGVYFIVLKLLHH